MPRSLWVALIAFMTAAPVAAEPYRVEGMRLGMTLPELRRSPALGAGNRLICNIDKEADDLRPQPDYLPLRSEHSPSAPICGLYRYGLRTERASSLPPEWYPTRMRMGSIDVFPGFQFVASEDSDKTPRLALITLRTNASLWDNVVAMLSARFGRPATRARPGPTAGAAYADNEVVTWDNGDSLIKAVKRSDRFQRTTITFEHTGLAALARWRAAGGAPVQ